ncbi:maleylacetoacetate isomerase [Azotobacter bryophylli]|uniref:Maleylacetoacetate isomerase n=1 Tax=Azotobacter bryophylli TaxID=1986537 RepID=A0ABV7B247_9GAMM
MNLYSYFRSSAAYRVRIALNLKGLTYRTLPVHLLRDGGEQHRPAYRAVNPAGLVPALEDRGHTLTQSLAILEYLEEQYPQTPLLPQGSADRARVRAIAQSIACEIHPLNNLRVLQYLSGTLGLGEEQKNAWYRHWVGEGLGAVERLLADDRRTGAFCHGDRPTLADCCLVPQVFNARRFGCELDAMPTILAIVARCQSLEAFQRAAPEHQPDAD